MVFRCKEGKIAKVTNPDEIITLMAGLYEANSIIYKPDAYFPNIKFITIEDDDRNDILIHKISNNRLYYTKVDPTINPETLNEEEVLENYIKPLESVFDRKYGIINKFMRYKLIPYIHDVMVVKFLDRSDRSMEIINHYFSIEYDISYNMLRKDDTLYFEAHKGTLDIKNNINFSTLIPFKYTDETAESVCGLFRTLMWLFDKSTTPTNINRLDEKIEDILFCFDLHPTLMKYVKKEEEWEINKFMEDITEGIEDND